MNYIFDFFMFLGKTYDQITADTIFLAFVFLLTISSIGALYFINKETKINKDSISRIDTIMKGVNNEKFN